MTTVGSAVVSDKTTVGELKAMLVCIPDVLNGEYIGDRYSLIEAMRHLVFEGYCVWCGGVARKGVMCESCRKSIVDKRTETIKPCG